MRVVLILLCFSLGCSSQDIDQNSGDRAALSSQEAYGEFLSKGLERGSITSERVKQAMSRVPRHLFVPENIRDLAYEDRALPIGYDQTISQTYIVALMTQASEVASGSRVLEVGTGSGFQAAVLAELGARVYSVEIVPELAERAQDILTSLGYNTVEVRAGDGAAGWRENAPYDAILVTAASPKIPSGLVEQLANRGKLVIPLERDGAKGEELLIVERDGDDLITRTLGPVRFVPMTGEVRDRRPKEEPQLLKEALQGEEAELKQSVSPEESRLQTPITKKESS